MKNNDDKDSPDFDEDFDFKNLPENYFAKLFEETIAKPLKEIRTDHLISVINCQQRDGSMEIDKNVVWRFNIDPDEVQQMADDLECSADVDKLRLLSTAILLEILEQRFASEKESWETIAKFSQDWLGKVISTSFSTIYGANLQDWAKDYVEQISAY